RAPLPPPSMQNRFYDLLAIGTVAGVLLALVLAGSFRMQKPRSDLGGTSVGPRFSHANCIETVRPRRQFYCPDGFTYDVTDGRWSRVGAITPMPGVPRG